YWSNSCCSHPRRGEDIELAVTRRLEQELGFGRDDLNSLEFLYKFEYVAHFGEAGTEHELCSVFVGHTGAEPVVNTAEIKQWAWLGKDQLTAQLAAEPDRFTPWLQLEWAKLSLEYAQKIA
ncbi:MAG: NUDIX domain-containing protein, partial [Gammaproteobacteria bacterium]|nr:NUDIX domain-containing protein [Gammaproteobacteria bacterium]